MMDVALTVMNVVGNVLLGGAALVMLIGLVLSICCGELSGEQAAAERRDALVAEYELQWRSPAAPPAPVEVELMRPVVLPVAVAPVVAQLGYFPYSAEGRRASEKLVCAICLEVFEHGAVCSEVPECQHLFHNDCTDVWMETKTTCPLCRRHIVAGLERLSAADDMV
ncbi:hypothetical protein ACQ4PT_009294 [Festuca glaucescens]